MEENRKFTIAKLEFRKLTISDWAYVIAYLGALLYYTFVESKEIKDLSSIALSFALGLQTISSPFGLRFRNIYFSSVWIVLSLLFIIDNTLLAFFPLLTFMLYHILRLVFWGKYNRELIPFEIGRGAIFRYKSRIEGRSGTQADKKFTAILLRIGIIIMFILLWAWV